MGNVCGGTKALNDHPTHHRLGSVSDTPRPQTQGSNDANSAEERARRAQAAEERAKAAAARGTVASNPKQGQLAAKLQQPVDRTYNNERGEEPLRWD
ncbi:hypothetical protein OPQ81_009652 [Rhizoctonia solani]|nr:hypothetical protein OPQ81_009652 [Rhizoctonia solani]